MYNSEVELLNETGLHARPASMFVDQAGKYRSDIKILKNNKEYNAKSIISVLSMGAVKGDKLMIFATGEDEKQAVNALQTLIANNFKE